MLGFPCLHAHDPQFSGQHMILTHLSTYYMEYCLKCDLCLCYTMSIGSSETVHILKEYNDLKEVINKECAMTLPPTDYGIVPSNPCSTFHPPRVECTHKSPKIGITIQYLYPLSLVPPSQKQVREACFSPKLDLQSTWNLIREGDEWKTEFHTTRGSYYK